MPKTTMPPVTRRSSRRGSPPSPRIPRVSSPAGARRRAAILRASRHRVQSIRLPRLPEEAEHHDSTEDTARHDLLQVIRDEFRTLAQSHQPFPSTISQTPASTSQVPAAVVQVTPTLPARPDLTPTITRPISNSQVVYSQLPGTNPLPGAPNVFK